MTQTSPFGRAKVPNLFILGAAKSGTTTLYELLRQHPDIFLTEVKEPTFFCRPFQVVANPLDYFDLYAKASHERYLGEASHAYMTQPEAAGLLAALFPDARFVVVLRNPADRAYSLYHHMRRRGYEYAASFERALELEETRVSSRRFQQACPQYLYNFLYFRSGLFGEQIERYLQLFDRRQFHFLTSDQLHRDTLNAVRGILEFLGLPSDFTPEIARHNEGRFTIRYPALQYLLRTKMRGLGFIRNLGLKASRHFNRAPLPPIDPETRSRLLRRYAEDLSKLEALTGISFAETPKP